MHTFLMGVIRHLPGVGPAEERDLLNHPLQTDIVPSRSQADGGGRRPSASRKVQNILIQSASADIVVRLIAADLLHSQRADITEELVSEVLRKHDAFSGLVLPHSPQPIIKSR